MNASEYSCPTCSLSWNPDGILSYDPIKYLTSPVPCPDCQERSRTLTAEFATRLRTAREEAVMSALVSIPEASE